MLTPAGVGGTLGGPGGFGQTYLQNPYYFMFASLAKPDEDVELHWMKVCVVSFFLYSCFVLVVCAWFAIIAGHVDLSIMADASDGELVKLGIRVRRVVSLALPLTTFGLLGPGPGLRTDMAICHSTGCGNLSSPHVALQLLDGERRATRSGNRVALYSVRIWICVFGSWFGELIVDDKSDDDLSGRTDSVYA